MGEWQPIASAPKDGRAVLLYPSACWCTEDDRGEVAYWDNDAEAWDRMGPVADDYTGPTHWMPLPPPPQPESEPAPAPVCEHFNLIADMRGGPVVCSDCGVTVEQATQGED